MTEQTQINSAENTDSVRRRTGCWLRMLSKWVLRRQDDCLFVSLRRQLSTPTCLCISVSEIHCCWYWRCCICKYNHITHSLSVDLLACAVFSHLVPMSNMTISNPNLKLGNEFTCRRFDLVLRCLYGYGTFPLPIPAPLAWLALKQTVN